VKQLPLKIKNIEKKEKKGSHGAWRHDFCEKYQDLLFRIRENSLSTFNDTLSQKGEQITCREGCVHCCFHYVTVSLAHGIVIVDYLYKRKNLLGLFLKNYRTWHEKSHAIADNLDRKRDQAHTTSKPIELLMAETRPLSTRYLEMGIPCPFLVNNQCCIYEVRPLSCSGHYSVSPPEWCAHNSAHKPVLYNLQPSDDDLLSMMRLADPKLVLFEKTFPMMIYRLLTEGSASLKTEAMQYDFA